MTGKRESPFTELFEVWSLVRDILRKRNIDVTMFLCALALMFVANHFFWVAAVFYGISLQEHSGSEAAYAYAMEMLYTCDVAAVLALVCLYGAFRPWILSKLFPNRSL